MASTDTSVPATETPDAVVAAAPSKKTATPNRFIELSVKDIITRAGDNIRSGELPDIEGLAASIAAEGLIEPIVVTPATDVAGKYTVVAGHRRLTAVRSLGLPTIAATIIDADADRRVRVALIENIQREDMNPVDKAKAIAKLLKNTTLEQQELAQALGVAPGYVSQYLNLLDLPESVLSAVQDNSLSFTHARTLCKLLPDVKAIDDLLFEASDLTVAALDAKVSHLVAKAKEAAAAAEPEEAEDGDDGKPKKKKKAAKPAPSDKAIEYYVDADFHPLKKDDIRELMVSYKRKEVNADTEKKREEYRLILKGITLAADLRLK
jgi:ParB/RepB/Spo0J family partition protein